MHMAVIGTVHLLAFGFDSQGSLPPGVGDRLHRLHGHGIIRLLDMLFVSKDERGILGPATTDGTDLDLGVAQTGSTLWQLLDGNGVATSPTTPLELQQRL
jgi:hypothetical protein